MCNILSHHHACTHSISVPRSICNATVRKKRRSTSTPTSTSSSISLLPLGSASASDSSSKATTKPACTASSTLTIYHYSPCPKCRYSAWLSHFKQRCERARQFLSTLKNENTPEDSAVEVVLRKLVMQVEEEFETQTWLSRGLENIEVDRRVRSRLKEIARNGKKRVRGSVLKCEVFPGDVIDLSEGEKEEGSEKGCEWGDGKYDPTTNYFSWTENCNNNDDEETFPFSEEKGEDDSGREMESTTDTQIGFDIDLGGGGTWVWDTAPTTTTTTTTTTSFSITTSTTTVTTTIQQRDILGQQCQSASSENGFSEKDAAKRSCTRQLMAWGPDTEIVSCTPTAIVGMNGTCTEKDEEQCLQNIVARFWSFVNEISETKLI